MALINSDINQAASFLKKGEIISIPTETVYGLAGNALNAEVVVKIFEIKNRPSFDPLIVHTHHLDQIRDFVTGIPEQALVLAQAFWPGPLTLLLPRKPVIPDIVTSGLDTVAVRIPHHPLTLALLAQLPFPLAAPSANPFGYISPTRASHVNDQLGEKIPFILDGGPCHIGVESTIIGFPDAVPTVFRLGGKSVEEIEEKIGKVQVMPQSSSQPNAPGMLKSHYAPGKKVILGQLPELLARYRDQEVGLLSFQNFYQEVPAAHQIQLSPQGNLHEASQRLFSALRALDQLPVKIILAEPVPDQGLGRAINDRLKRASA